MKYLKSLEYEQAINFILLQALLALVEDCDGIALKVKIMPVS